MNRAMIISAINNDRVPRTRGDEPVSAISLTPLPWRSPHTRG